MPLVQWVECLPNTHEVRGSIPDCLNWHGGDFCDSSTWEAEAEQSRSSLIGCRVGGKPAGLKGRGKRAQTYLLGKSFLEHSWDQNQLRSFLRLPQMWWAEDLSMGLRHHLHQYSRKGQGDSSKEESLPIMYDSPKCINQAWGHTLVISALWSWRWEDRDQG